MKTFYVVSGLFYLFIGLILLGVDDIFVNDYTRIAFYVVDVAFVVAGLILLLGAAQD